MEENQIDRFPVEAWEKIVIPLISQLIVQNEWVEDFYKDNKGIIEKVYMYILSEETFNDDLLVILDGGNYYKLNKMSELLENNNDVVNDFPEMILFEIFSILEGYINFHLYSELVTNHNFSISKISTILQKLSLNDKIDWFMELLVGETFVTHPSWGEIKPYLKVRNSLVHLKPKQLTKERELEEKISINNLKTLIKEIQNLCNDVYQNKSPKMLADEQKISKIRKILETNLNNGLLKNIQ